MSPPRNQEHQYILYRRIFPKKWSKISQKESKFDRKKLHTIPEYYKELVYKFLAWSGTSKSSYKKCPGAGGGGGGGKKNNYYNYDEFNFRDIWMVSGADVTEETKIPKDPFSNCSDWAQMDI